MRKAAFVIISVVMIFSLAYAMPEDAGFGVYIAPMFASGHFGVSATNMPASITATTTGISVSLNPVSVDAGRGFSYGGKLGLFYRPDNYDRRHRFDLEVQGDFFSNYFDFQYIEIDAAMVETFGVETWDLDGIGLAAKIRWSAEVQERWQPYVHFGYGVNLLKLEKASGVGHGFNLGAGMRVRLCSKYAFYFEYETCPMRMVDFTFSDIGEDVGSLTGELGVDPGYSQVMVAFEFPINFCVECGSSNYHR